MVPVTLSIFSRLTCVSTHAQRTDTSTQVYNISTNVSAEDKMPILSDMEAMEFVDLFVTEIALNHVVDIIKSPFTKVKAGVILEDFLLIFFV